MHGRYAGIARVLGAPIAINWDMCWSLNLRESALIARAMDASTAGIRGGMRFSVRMIPDHHPACDEEWQSRQKHSKRDNLRVDTDI